MALNFMLYEQLKQGYAWAVSGGGGGGSSGGSGGGSGSGSGGGGSAADSTVAKLGCGMVSGATAKLVVYPLDTVKKRMQVR
jgi:hypothetical protein